MISNDQLHKIDSIVLPKLVRYFKSDDFVHRLKKYLKFAIPDEQVLIIPGFRDNAIIDRSIFKNVVSYYYFNYQIYEQSFSILNIYLAVHLKITSNHAIIDSLFCELMLTPHKSSIMEESIRDELERHQMQLFNQELDNDKSIVLPIGELLPFKEIKINDK